MYRGMLLGSVLLSFSAATTQAQTCLGLPSLSRVTGNLNATVQTGNDQTVIGAGLNWGGSGPFAHVGVGYINFDDIDESAYVLGVGVGSQLRTTASSKVQLCPMAAFDYQSGPNFDDFGESVDLSVWTLSAGLNLGIPMDAGTGLQLIPSGGAAVAYSKFEADAGSLGSTSDSDTYGILSFGLGVLMNQTFSIRPQVDIPVGLEDVDPFFSVTVSIGFGRRK